MKTFNEISNKEKATIYYKNSFGSVSKLEVKLIEYGLKKYAQYDAVPFVKYIKKGCRKSQGFTCSGFRPFLLIVKNWNQPNCPDAFETPVKSENCVIQKSKYLSFDSRYTEDFNEGTEFNEIIMDARYNSTTSVNSEVAGDSEDSDKEIIVTCGDEIKYRGFNSIKGLEIKERFEDNVKYEDNRFYGCKVVMK